MGLWLGRFLSAGDLHLSCGVLGDECVCIPGSRMLARPIIPRFNMSANAGWLFNYVTCSSFNTIKAALLRYSFKKFDELISLDPAEGTADQEKAGSHKLKCMHQGEGDLLLLQIKRVS
jgi:hypothetical protein